MRVMNIRNSEAERQVRAPQRAAMSIDEFCQRHAVGRTTVYGQIKQGRLLALKVGKRTLITEDDAEDWLRRLPVIETRSWVRPAQPDGQGRPRGDWHSLQPAASSRFTVLTHKKNLNVHRISLVRSTTA
jgi:excisionase family DNA binding protein